MRLHSDSFADQTAMPESLAFCRYDAQSRVALGGNVSPHLAWDNVPQGTQSFVIICHDPDAPSKPDDVNQEDREIPQDLARTTFYHWVLVNIEASVRSLAEGAYSKGITPRGKAGPLALDDTRQGINDYTSWFASDRDMSGDYFGYDGPCPPWNDSIKHRYIFTVYALDVAELNLEGRFSGEDVTRAMEGHILAQASLTGIYTLNPRLFEQA